MKIKTKTAKSLDKVSIKSKEKLKQSQNILRVESD